MKIKVTIKLTNHDRHGSFGGNSTCKALAAQWLIEALCFVSSSFVADSIELRNRQLLLAINRCQKDYKKSQVCLS